MQLFGRMPKECCMTPCPEDIIVQAVLGECSSYESMGTRIKVKILTQVDLNNGR